MKNELAVSNLQCVRQQKIIFADLSFRLAAGEVLIIEGPNGSGKSSLLRLLSGIMTPDKGEIHFNQQSIQQLGSGYAQCLHYLAHTNGLKLPLTVHENISFTEKLSGGTALSTDKIAEVLKQLQLTTLAHTPILHLSAGQKRRVSLAKLILFPKLIWILDEPLTGLDKVTQQLLLTWLDEHLQNKGLCVLSSHHTLTIAQATFLRLGPC